MPVLFDWGTYNALTTLWKAEVLGTRLTEIPPADFSRRSRDESYFKSYAEEARKVFTTITAHAPYYSLVTYHPETRARVLKAMKHAVRMAALAGAEVFNVHLGPKVMGPERDCEVVAEIVKELLKVDDKIYISLETSYSSRMLGSLEEIRAIIEAVGSDRVIVSAQLENDFMREMRVDEHGNFELANREATEDFWYGLLKKVLELSKGFLSLRFSQVTGFYFGRRLLKKRVPLGRGYPDVKPLARALARLMVKEVYKAKLPLRMHLIYTGPWDSKYQDTVKLYSAVMEEVAPILG